MVLAHEVFDDTEVVRLEGRVKWYDPARGYGFIDATDGLGIFSSMQVVSDDLVRDRPCPMPA